MPAFSVLFLRYNLGIEEREHNHEKDKDRMYDRSRIRK